MHKIQTLERFANACSFVVPRWGGVAIHNPPNLNATTPAPHRSPLPPGLLVRSVLQQLLQLLPGPSLVRSLDTLVLV